MAKAVKRIIPIPGEETSPKPLNRSRKKSLKDDCGDVVFGYKLPKGVVKKCRVADPKVRSTEGASPSPAPVQSGGWVEKPNYPVKEVDTLPNPDVNLRTHRGGCGKQGMVHFVSQKINKGVRWVDIPMDITKYPVFDTPDYFDSPLEWYFYLKGYMNQYNIRRKRAGLHTVSYLQVIQPELVELYREQQRVDNRRYNGYKDKNDVSEINF